MMFGKIITRLFFRKVEEYQPVKFTTENRTDHVCIEFRMDKTAVQSRYDGEC